MKGDAMEQDTDISYLIGKGFTADYIARYLKAQIQNRVMLPGFSAEETIRYINSSEFFYEIMHASGFETNHAVEDGTMFENGVRAALNSFNQ